MLEGRRGKGGEEMGRERYVSFLSWSWKAQEIPLLCPPLSEQPLNHKHTRENDASLFFFPSSFPKINSPVQGKKQTSVPLLYVISKQKVLEPISQFLQGFHQT